jgi:hypothetical protein
VEPVPSSLTHRIPVVDLVGAMVVLDGCQMGLYSHCSAYAGGVWSSAWRNLSSGGESRVVLMKKMMGYDV